MLKIGAENVGAAKITQNELAKIGQSCEVIDSTTFKNLSNLLLGGQIDLAVFPLKNLPPNLPEGIVITAVSGRENGLDWLAISPQSIDNQKLLQLRAGATVAVFSERQRLQFLDFRKDVALKMEEKNWFSVLEKLKNGTFDAAIFPADEGLELSSFHLIKLNPQEFLPEPGQGVLAFLANAQDLPTRRILKKIHHPEVSALTNVERGVLKIFTEKEKTLLGVYCERDNSGNFHAFAATKIGESLRQTRVSQSTNFGLAEKISNKLL